MWARTATRQGPDIQSSKSDTIPSSTRRVGAAHLLPHVPPVIFRNAGRAGNWKTAKNRQLAAMRLFAQVVGYRLRPVNWPCRTSAVKFFRQLLQQIT